MEQIGFSLVVTASGVEEQSWDAFPASIKLPDGSVAHGWALNTTIRGRRLVERWRDTTYGVPVPDTVTYDGTKTTVHTVLQDPPPANLDPFYGPVILDPANPGHWIQQPYTPAEMKPRLEDYSSVTRLFYETSGVMIHPAAGTGDYAASTTRDDRLVVESAFTFLKDAPPGTMATLKLMRIKTVSPPAYGSVLFAKSNLARVTEVKTAVDKWSDLCFTQEHTLFDQIEAGTITTKDQIDAAYLATQQGAFPIAP